MDAANAPKKARELQEGVWLGAAMDRFDGHQKLFD
jgi:hypothetical protein